MGLINAVIADARPAKSEGRSTNATAHFAGQPPHKPRTESGTIDSGADPSAKAKDYSNESINSSAFGLNTTLKYDLPSVSYNTEKTGKPILTESRRDNPSESGSIVLHSNMAVDKVRRPRNDPIPPVKRIDQSIVDPVTETVTAEQPTFTLFNKNIENTEHPQSHSGADRQKDVEQVSTIVPTEASTPVRKAGRDMPNDAADLPVGRHDNHDATSVKSTGTIDTVNKSTVSWSGEEAHAAEAKPQATTYLDHPALKNDLGLTARQAVTEVQSGLRHYSPAKSQDRQPESRSSPQSEGQPRHQNRPEAFGAPNTTGRKAGQQPSMDPAAFRRQQTPAPTPVSTQPDVQAKLKKLTSTIQEQLHEQVSSAKSVELVEARSISMIDDQMAKHPLREPRSQNKPIFEAPRTAEVKIGQIDVFVEKSSPTTSRGINSVRPSVSLASRHYLRRL